MCRMVLYDYTPCGHQSAPSLQRCQQAVERNIAICSDVNEEDQPEAIIPLEQSCPSCSQGQSHDDLGDSASVSFNDRGRQDR